MASSFANETCQSCRAQLAVVCCKCSSPPALLCFSCSALHQAKNPNTAHLIMSIAALGHDSVDYTRKFNALAEGKAELRRNVKQMKQFADELAASVDAVMAQMMWYRDSWVQWIEGQLEEVGTAVEAAIQEADACLAQGWSPCNPLAHALLAWTPQQLQFFTSAVTPPDFQSLTRNWAVCQNHFQRLCSPVSSDVQPSTTSQCLAYVTSSLVKVYDCLNSTWSWHPLTSSITVDDDSQYLWVDTALFCSGGNSDVGKEGKTESYLLGSGNEWTVTRLADMLIPRGHHGLWYQSAHLSVLVFGGITGSGIVYSECRKECELLNLQTGIWRAISNMHESRAYLHPCEFVGIVYLCGALSSIMEAYNPNTEAFLSYHYLLPESALCFAFEEKGQLVVLSTNQMSKWGSVAGQQLMQLSNTRNNKTTLFGNMRPVLDPGKGLVYVSFGGRFFSVKLDGSEQRVIQEDK